MPVVIETPRLLMSELDPESADDARDMLGLLNDPGFIDGIGDRGVRSVEQAADYLRGWHGTRYARDGFGHYALRLRDGGDFLGTAGLIQRPDLALPDIGYALLAGYRGRGYAEEAARAVLVHARDALGLPGLCAIVSPGNGASMRLLEKLGLRREGEYVIAPEREPLAYYVTAFRAGAPAVPAAG